MGQMAASQTMLRSSIKHRETKKLQSPRKRCPSVKTLALSSLLSIPNVAHESIALSSRCPVICEALWILPSKRVGPRKTYHSPRTIWLWELLQICRSTKLWLEKRRTSTHKKLLRSVTRGISLIISIRHWAGWTQSSKRSLSLEWQHHRRMDSPK